MKNKYYIGNYEKVRNIETPEPHRKDKWWIVGHFMPEEFQRTKDMGVKYWTFNIGQEKTHPPKIEPRSTECTIIFKGCVKGSIEGKEITLSAGEYIVIPPGIKNNLIEEIREAPLEGITIKAPNDPKFETIKLKYP